MRSLSTKRSDPRSTDYARELPAEGEAGELRIGVEVAKNTEVLRLATPSSKEPSPGTPVRLRMTAIKILRCWGAGTRPGSRGCRVFGQSFCGCQPCRYISTNN